MKNIDKQASASEQRLVSLTDIANVAHFRIQQDFEDIDPVIGINRSMRKNGVPADLMTIDCLKTGKRILVVLHDHSPEFISYQFTFNHQDPAGEFKEISQAAVNQAILYDWIKCYFSGS
ncbi:hypothetical protein ACVFI8_16125 [Agarivorans sp. MS3-6]